MSHAFTEEPTATIAAFLVGIGIPVESTVATEDCFVPGIRLDRGRLLVDESRLSHPGDLLHEAGHIAVMTPSRRAGCVVDVGKNLGDEIAAIAWSWAALTHLRLAPEVVFHSDGYRGSAGWLVETFTGGSYPGLPLLQWMGLTLDAEVAERRDIDPFPHMIRWLRTAEVPSHDPSEVLSVAD